MRKIIFLVLLFVAGLAWSQEVGFEGMTKPNVGVMVTVSTGVPLEVLSTSLVFTDERPVLDIRDYDTKWVDVRVTVEEGEQVNVYYNIDGESVFSIYVRDTFTIRLFNQEE